MLNHGTAQSAQVLEPRTHPGVQLYPVAAAAPFTRRLPSSGRAGVVLLSSILGFAALLAVSAAQAQRPKVSEPPSATPGSVSPSRARAHFEAGLEHYRARRFREAIRELELAQAEVSSAEIWFDIGRAHEQLGEYGPAIESYRLYLRDRVDAPDAQEVHSRIDALVALAQAQKNRPRSAVNPSSALAIDAAQPGAIVLLDGRQVGVGPLDQIVEVPPGRHRLEAIRSGFVPFRARLDIGSGAVYAAYVDMHPLSGPTDAPRSRLWTWVTASGSAAALLASGGLGLEAMHERDRGDLRAARRWASASDLVLGGAISLALLATVLYFAEAPPR